MKTLTTQVLLCTLLLVGCDKLSPAVLVKDTRVIGGEVSVEGDPTRASPRAGEQANVRLYVAAPVGVNDTLNWGFYPCLASLTAGGLPRCEGDASADAFVLGSGEPIFSFTTPTPVPPPDTAPASDAKPTVLVIGIICINGSPTFDPTTMQPSCGADATRSFPLVMRVPIEVTDADTNHNPVFGDILDIDDVAWPANDAAGLPATGCASTAATADLPHLSIADGERKINFVMLDHANSEVITTDMTTGTPVLETLQINMTTTLGDTSGSPFEVVDGAMIPDSFDIKWVPPETVSADGEVAKFWFVMRDGRNGATLTQRAACVVP